MAELLLDPVLGVLVLLVVDVLLVELLLLDVPVVLLPPDLAGALLDVEPERESVR
ncbi:hypothetical protein [Cellulomonas denverensis]|uniref:hypothetical protein n=1 Tax=Cellulomonas denverensis TaxID=264297 RepID=UPI001A49FE7F|nr:hypothetical protein [Cellulomonas denverensis]GIG24607.1 hypothetical protein Cde04nite_08510 [Cellulomonas denverensis]